MPDITSVTVTFGHGIKREEYGPTKKAEVTITASVADGEMGEHVLATISALALARVAAMLDAPKPLVEAQTYQAGETVTTGSGQTATAGQPSSGEAPARRTRGPNKKTDEPKAAETSGTAEPQPEPTPTAEAPQPAAEDEWAAGAEDITISDQEILSATSKRAGELGAREPIVKLIATFATRTEGAPFKVQEIPQAQRKDYLDKLAALAA